MVDDDQGGYQGMAWITESISIETNYNLETNAIDVNIHTDEVDLKYQRSTQTV